MQIFENCNMRGHFTQQIRKAMTQGKIFKIFKKQLNQINLKYVPVEILGTCLLFSVHWRFVVIRFLLSTNIIFLCSTDIIYCK